MYIEVEGSDYLASIGTGRDIYIRKEDVEDYIKLDAQGEINVEVRILGYAYRANRSLIKDYIERYNHNLSLLYMEVMLRGGIVRFNDSIRIVAFKDRKGRKKLGLASLTSPKGINDILASRGFTSTINSNSGKITKWHNDLVSFNVERVSYLGNPGSYCLKVSTNTKIPQFESVRIIRGSTSRDCITISTSEVSHKCIKIYSSICTLEEQVDFVLNLINLVNSGSGDVSLVTECYIDFSGRICLKDYVIDSDMNHTARYRYITKDSYLWDDKYDALAMRVGSKFLDEIESNFGVLRCIS